MRAALKTSTDFPDGSFTDLSKVVISFLILIECGLVGVLISGAGVYGLAMASLIAPVLAKFVSLMNAPRIAGWMLNIAGLASFSICVGLFLLSVAHGANVLGGYPGTSCSPLGIQAAMGGELVPPESVYETNFFRSCEAGFSELLNYQGLRVARKCCIKVDITKFDCRHSGLRLVPNAAQDPFVLLNSDMRRAVIDCCPQQSGGVSPIGFSAMLLTAISATLTAVLMNALQRTTIWFNTVVVPTRHLMALTRPIMDNLVMFLASRIEYLLDLWENPPCFPPLEERNAGVVGEGATRKQKQGKLTTAIAKRGKKKKEFSDSDHSGDEGTAARDPPLDVPATAVPAAPLTIVPHCEKQVGDEPPNPVVADGSQAESAVIREVLDFAVNGSQELVLHQGTAATRCGSYFVVSGLGAQGEHHRLLYHKDHFPLKYSTVDRSTSRDDDNDVGVSHVLRMPAYGNVTFSPCGKYVMRCETGEARTLPTFHHLARVWLGTRKQQQQSQSKMDEVAEIDLNGGSKSLVWLSASCPLLSSTNSLVELDKNQLTTSAICRLRTSQFRSAPPTQIHQEPSQMMCFVGYSHIASEIVLIDVDTYFNEIANHVSLRDDSEQIDRYDFEDFHWDEEKYVRRIPFPDALSLQYTKQRTASTLLWNGWMLLITANGTLSVWSLDEKLSESTLGLTRDELDWLDPTPANVKKKMWAEGAEVIEEEVSEESLEDYFTSLIDGTCIVQQFPHGKDRGTTSDVDSAVVVARMSWLLHDKRMCFANFVMNSSCKCEVEITFVDVILERYPRDDDDDDDEAAHDNVDKEGAAHQGDGEGQNGSAGDNKEKAAIDELNKGEGEAEQQAPERAHTTIVYSSAARGASRNVFGGFPKGDPYFWLMTGQQPHQVECKEATFFRLPNSVHTNHLSLFEAKGLVESGLAGITVTDGIGSVRCWDAGLLTEITSPELQLRLFPSGAITSSLVSANAKYIAATNIQGLAVFAVAELFEAATRRPKVPGSMFVDVNDLAVTRISGTTSEFSFTPDGEAIYADRVDQGIFVTSIVAPPVSDIAVIGKSTNGDRIITVDAANKSLLLTVLDANNDNITAEVLVRHTISVHSRVRSVRLSPDGALLVVTTVHGEIQCCSLAVVCNGDDSFEIRHAFIGSDVFAAAGQGFVSVDVSFGGSGSDGIATIAALTVESKLLGHGNDSAQGNERQLIAESVDDEFGNNPPPPPVEKPFAGDNELPTKEVNLEPTNADDTALAPAVHNLLLHLFTVRDSLSRLEHMAVELALPVKNVKKASVVETNDDEKVEVESLNSDDEMRLAKERELSLDADHVIVTSMAYSPDDKTIAVWVKGQSRLLLWTLPSGNREGQSDDEVCRVGAMLLRSADLAVYDPISEWKVSAQGKIWFHPELRHVLLRFSRPIGHWTFHIEEWDTRALLPRQEETSPRRIRPRRTERIGYMTADAATVFGDCFPSADNILYLSNFGIALMRRDASEEKAAAVAAMEEAVNSYYWWSAFVAQLYAPSEYLVFPFLAALLGIVTSAVAGIRDGSYDTFASLIVNGAALNSLCDIASVFIARSVIVKSSFLPVNAQASRTTVSSNDIDFAGFSRDDSAKMLARALLGLLCIAPVIHVYVIGALLCLAPLAVLLFIIAVPTLYVRWVLLRNFSVSIPVFVATSIKSLSQSFCTKLTKWLTMFWLGTTCIVPPDSYAAVGRDGDLRKKTKPTLRVSLCLRIVTLFLICFALSVGVNFTVQLFVRFPSNWGLVKFNHKNADYATIYSDNSCFRFSDNQVKCLDWGCSYCVDRKICSTTTNYADVCPSDPNPPIKRSKLNLTCGMMNNSCDYCAYGTSACGFCPGENKCMNITAAALELLRTDYGFDNLTSANFSQLNEITNISVANFTSRLNALLCSPHSGGLISNAWFGNGGSFSPPAACNATVTPSLPSSTWWWNDWTTWPYVNPASSVDAELFFYSLQVSSGSCSAAKSTETRWESINFFASIP